MHRAVGLATILAVFTADQVSKHAALALLPSSGARSVMPFVGLRLGYNEGVSFGLLADQFAGRAVVLATFTLIVVLLLALYMWRSSGRVEAIALGAMIGGALGNILDRLRIGAVVDFLDLHVGTYHWPTFNLADTAIVAGCALLVTVTLFGGRRAP